MGGDVEAQEEVAPAQPEGEQAKAEPEKADPAEQTAAEPQAEAAAAPGCCSCCSCCSRCWQILCVVYWRLTAMCCGCFCLLLVGVGIFLAIFFLMTQNPCSVMSFDAKYVLPSEAAAAGLGRTVDVATRANINTSIPLDFTGIWWIRWADPAWNIQAYNSLHLEEGLTFVGMRSNSTGPPWFPAELKIPTGLNHRWMFSDSAVGRAAMIISSEQKDPFGELTIRMLNETYGIVEVGDCNWIWKLDDDRWLRRSAITGCVNSEATADAIIVDYELTRIVFEDGSPHPVYWPLWLEHMKHHEVRVFIEDNWCRRRLGAKTSDCQAVEQDCQACEVKCR